MLGKMFKKAKVKKRIARAFPVLIGIFLIIAAFIIRGTGAIKGNEEKLLSSSTLTKIVNISELSTAKFTYNGIATIYEDKEEKEVKCHIRYDSKVKAGIDMSKIEINVNEDEKKVEISLPEIKITALTPDSETLSFIPHEPEIEMGELISACKKDAVEEAEESSELYKMAETNLKNTIEALLYPILKPNEYVVEWQ